MVIGPTLQQVVLVRVRMSPSTFQTGASVAKSKFMLNLSGVYMSTCNTILIVSCELEIFHNVKRLTSTTTRVAWIKIKQQRFDGVSNVKILKENG